ARHAETVCSCPSGSGGTDRKAGILAIEQIEVRGGPVYRRRKPRDFVSAADDSESGLAELRRLGTRILSAGIVVTKRCRRLARNVVSPGCRRVIGRPPNSINHCDLSHCDLLSSLVSARVQPFAPEHVFRDCQVGSPRLPVASRETR